jgi:hypothetical protein
MAESLLRGSCWVESLHAATRTRTNMATFRLTARARDPADIRSQAILEIVEIIPACSMSQAPTVRMLTYPISIRLSHVVPIAPASFPRILLVRAAGLTMGAATATMDVPLLSVGVVDASAGAQTMT